MLLGAFRTAGTPVFRQSNGALEVFPTDNYTAKADNNCVSPLTTPAEFAFLRILRHPEEEPPTRFLLPVAPEEWSV